MLACQFVGCREKPGKPLHPSSLSRPVNTARGDKTFTRGLALPVTPKARISKRKYMYFG